MTTANIDAIIMPLGPPTARPTITNNPVSDANKIVVLNILFMVYPIRWYLHLPIYLIGYIILARMYIKRAIPMTKIRIFVYINPQIDNCTQSINTFKIDGCRFSIKNQIYLIVSNRSLIFANIVFVSLSVKVILKYRYARLKPIANTKMSSAY